MISIMIAAVALSMSGNMAMADAKDDERLAQIGSKIGLVFPAGAVLIGTAGESGIDELVQIKIRTDRTGLRDFLRSNEIDEAGFDDAQRALLLPDADWWDPSRAPALPTAQIRRPGGPTLNIGYASTPAGAVELYVMWFTT